MYCAACGSANDDTASTCESCGNPLQSVGAVPPAPPPSAPVAGDWQGGAPASAHLAQSILVTLFCCQPAGIVAIVYSAIAMGKNSSGDYAGAAKAAKTASLWAWIGFGFGFVVVLLYVGLVVIGALASAAGGP